MTNEAHDMSGCEQSVGNRHCSISRQGNNQGMDPQALNQPMGLAKSVPADPPG